MCLPENFISLILSQKKRNSRIFISNSFYKLYFKAKIFSTYPKTNWLSHIFDFARKNIQKLSRNFFFRFDAAKLFTSLLVTNVFLTILFIFIILSLAKSDWATLGETNYWINFNFSGHFPEIILDELKNYSRRFFKIENIFLLTGYRIIFFEFLALFNFWRCVFLISSRRWDNFKTSF